jgi:hypothetical protein
MVIDGALQFSGTAGVAGSMDNPTTGTQQSTNIIDLVASRDMGIGDNPAMKLLVQVGTTFTAGTSLQIQFQGAPNNAGSPGTWTTYAESAAILEADLISGRSYLLPIDVPRPPPGSALPRFYRLQYVSAGTHTAGGIFAALVLDRQDYVVYPAGIVILN